MLKLAYQYMRYYKSQTFAIWASIVLTAALLSGVSSLMYSSQMNRLENHKMLYGNWHYCIDAGNRLENTDKDESDGAGILEETDADGKKVERNAGFLIEQYGKKEVKGALMEPYRIYFVNTDESYRQMAHREIVDGNYPNGADEIAADYYTLGNLGFSGEIGDTLNLDGKDYVLTGIIKGAWASGLDEMEIFVGKDFAGQDSRTFYYLRFDEGKKLYKQLDAFLDKFRISGNTVTANDSVTEDLGGEQPDSIYDILKFALTDEKGNFTYIILKLQSEYNLALNGMILLLCLFSLFICCSIFQISVSKRTSEYGIMQTLGISERSIGGTLILELWFLFLSGYPAGCLLGNGILNLFYHRFEGVFSTEAAQIAETGIEISNTDQISIQDGIGNASFYVYWNAVSAGFLFLLIMLAVVGFCTVYSMRRRSVRQVMSGDLSFADGKKIYSLRNVSLVNVVVRKFMFSNKKKVIGILLSLSIGGCIFLCTTYMVQNLKIHAEMSLKSDDGLGSEYRISIKSDLLSDVIPESAVDAVKSIPDLRQVYASKFVLGELMIQKRELEWDEYFQEMNGDSYLKQRFGGICVEKENGTYGIKYDIYGYDDGMIEQLQEFILEGEINPDELKKENKIITVANKDGQGNYDFYGKHPGDTVTLTVPKRLGCSEDVLKFQSAGKHYVKKEFKIAAVVSRALSQEDSWLNAGGWKNMQSLILTNQQMSGQFGIDDYSFVSASPAAGTDTAKISSQILLKIKDVPKAVLKDYTAAIQTQKNYLEQQQLFFSGIAVILLIISMFHIMNSMNFSILSHRREYGIMRAMGITDGGFYRMILKTGLMYGLMADLLIFLIYHTVFRKIMDYYMAHVVQFLHITAGVPNGIMAAVMGLNLLIAAAAVMIPARKLVKSDIMYEIRS